MRPDCTRFSVSATGTAGMAPSCVRSAASSAGMVVGGKNGRAASCTSTTSGACGTSACSPALTLPWRVSPPGTAGNTGRPSSAAVIASASPTGWITPAWGNSASAAWRITAFPAMEMNCFGTSPPKRLPEPAATKIAAIRMRRAMRGARHLVNASDRLIAMPLPAA